MDTKHLVQSIEKVKENSPKRKFSQTLDLIITLKDLDLKKPEQQIEFFATLPFTRGFETKVGALVGPELLANAKENCTTAISSEDFDDFAKDKKKIKKLAQAHDFFIAQATIMPKVATVFGKVLGPRGKMPNPKAGCVVPPNANLKQLVEKLRTMAKISAKTSLMVQIGIGKENQKTEEVAENIKSLYDQIIHHLPNEKNNLRKILLKLTMGKPFRLDDSGALAEAAEKKTEAKSE